MIPTKGPDSRTLIPGETGYPSYGNRVLYSTANSHNPYFHAMALEGLLYGSGREELVNDKAGFPIYTGTASHFEEWEFRVTAKWRALEKDEKAEQKRTELASKVTDALRDDAMKIAQDIGLETLIQKDGVPGLVKAMRDSVSVKRDLEAMLSPDGREYAELHHPPEAVVEQAYGSGRQVQRFGEHPHGHVAGRQ